MRYRFIVLAGLLILVATVSAFAQLISQDLSIIIQAPETVSPGTYNIFNGSLAMDGSFASGPAPYVRLSTLNPAAPTQQWVTTDGRIFKNVGLANGSLGNASGPYLADNGDGTVTVNSVGDSWSVSQAIAGFTMLDRRSGFYINNCAGILCMSGSIASGPPTLVSHAAGPSCTSGTSCTVTLQVTAGDNVLIGISFCGGPNCSLSGSTAVISIIDSSGLVKPACTVEAKPGMTGSTAYPVSFYGEVWRCPVISSGTANFTITTNASANFIQGFAADVSGLVSDDVGKFTQGTASVVSTSLTTTANNDFIFGVAGIAGNSNLVVAGSGYNIIDNIGGQADLYGGNNLAGSNTVSLNFNIGGGHTWGFAVAAFKGNGSGTTPTITSITQFTSTNNKFAANTPNAQVGTVSATLSSGTFTGTLAISPAGGGACGFHLTTTTSPAIVEANSSTGCAVGNYSDWSVVATQPGASNSPFTQPESAAAITVTAGSCTPFGSQAQADVSTAGFKTCALFSDWTATTGANWVPSFSGAVGTTSNWLDCSYGNPSGANWYFGTGFSGASAPATCSNITQATDPTGGPVLDIALIYSKLIQGNLASGYINMKTTSFSNDAAPASGLFPFLYQEITFRWDQTPNIHNVGAFWDWASTPGSNPFTERDSWECGGFVGQKCNTEGTLWCPSGGCGFWENSDVAFSSSFDPTAYHTWGAMWTGDGNGNYSACTYVDGVRNPCILRSDPPNANASAISVRERLQIEHAIYQVGGCTDGDWACINLPNFGTRHLYIKNVKVLSCASWTSTSAMCNGTMSNGNFYQ